MNFPVTAGGSASGSIDAGGSLQIRLTGNGCTLFGTGDASSFGGGAPATCVDSSLSGNLAFNASSGLSVPPNSKGPSGTQTNPTGSFGDPVNSATGNYYTSFTDLNVHGRGMSFVFNRYYNSLGGTAGPCGANWSHSFNVLLLADAVTGSIQIKQASGGILAFVLQGGSYVPVTNGSFDVLTHAGNGTYTLEYQNRTKLQFSSAGRLQSVTDRNGNSQVLAYSAVGDLTSITDTAGRVFNLSYDAAHRMVALTDPTGRMVRYSYDGSNNLAAVTDPAGGITRFTYDSNHRMLTGSDPRGIVYVQNTYDASGRVIAQKNGRGNPTTFAYSASFTRMIDPNGNASQHSYDKDLRLTQSIDGAGGIVALEYEANNLRSSVADPRGAKTAYTYDSRGNPLTVMDATGKTLTNTFDSHDNLLTNTDRAGQIITRTYDAPGNLLSIRDPLGGTVQNTFDAFGQVLSTTDPSGGKTNYQYDNSGNLIQTTDGAGIKSTMTYDPLGRLLTRTDGLGGTVRFQYDPLDRLTSVIDALGNQAQRTYDAVGNITKVTDANGNSESYTYDETNNLINVTDALGQKTTYGYDANDNRISRTDAKGRVTRFAYDAANRLTRVTDALNRSTAFSYDATGNRISVTDGNGKATRFAYDLLNQVVTVTYADNTKVSFSYDAAGNRTTMVDSNGTSRYSYDALRRVSAVTSSDGKVVRYEYDGAGRRTALTYPNGQVVQTRYDAAGRLTAVTDWNGNSFNYTYDAAGRLAVERFPNGVSVAHTYDAGGRLTGIATTPSAAGPADANYVLDKNGNILEANALGFASKYSYDALDRLTSWTSPSGIAVGYGYDAVGNRTSIMSPSANLFFTYDDGDQLTSAGATTFTYDGNGNRITRVAGGRTTTYSWNVANLLASVSTPERATVFTYDGDDQRVAQQSGGAVSKFFNDPIGLSNVLHEEGPAGAIDFVQGRSLISAITSQGSLHVSRDGSGNIASVSDAKGALNANYIYDPWGNLLNPADPLGSGLRYKFAGEAYDVPTGLYYMRARYYDPSTGTFLSKDPLGLRSSGAPDGNVYAYARSNPLRFSDPTGLAAEKSGTRDTTSPKYPPDWTDIDPETKNAIDAIMQQLGTREAWLHIHDGKMAVYGLTAEMEAFLRAGGIAVQVGTAFLDADTAAGFLAWLRAKNGKGIGFGSPGRGSGNQGILDGTDDDRMFRPPPPAQLADPSKDRTRQKSPCGRSSAAAC